MLLEPEIPVPPHTFNIHVGNDGKITGVVDGEPEVLGQIQLAEFDNPHGLEQG
jgi:flagellar basal body rod protein FlgG